MDKFFEWDFDKELFLVNNEIDITNSTIEYLTETITKCQKVVKEIFPYASSNQMTDFEKIIVLRQKELAVANEKLDLLHKRKLFIMKKNNLRN